MLPGEVTEGTPERWITQDEYLKARKQDETIHGILHTHPEAKTVFSESNIGFFLYFNDAFHVCSDSQGNYLLMLRTEKTDLSREGIFEEAVALYTIVARNATDRYVIEHDMDYTDNSTEAIEHGQFEAMKAVCKKYNIVLYIVKRGKAATKVR